MTGARRSGGRAAALALLPSAALVLTLTGCGKTVRASDVEGKVVKNLQGQMPSRTITVDCPDGKKAEKGTTFTCTAQIDGKASDVDVRLVSERSFSFRIHSRK
ncbi:hypothetical protein DSM112329_01463 [Paraconexibacter sp. AEG42_29]|uniref:DUF4333 domain-containing protein n=1 Tax=Paraconexibacter sp. AEG42_29 TaxID=2997339 RepID=A0AAU7ASJ6_9ACTN